MAKTKINDKIIAVSHARSCINFLISIGVDPQQFLKKRFGNCAIMIIDYQQGKFNLEDIINPN